MTTSAFTIRDAYQTLHLEGGVPASASIAGLRLFLQDLHDTDTETDPEDSPFRHLDAACNILKLTELELKAEEDARPREPTCPDCSSTDVYGNTTTVWDEAKGAWVMSDDASFDCNACGAEDIQIDWRPI